MAKPEAAIQRAVLDYLKAKGVFHIRVNSGAVVSQYKGKSRMIRYGEVGCADILAFTDASIVDHEGNEIVFSHPVWLEIKAPKGVQSEAQKAWEKRVKAEGHAYLLIKSVEDVMKVFV